MKCTHIALQVRDAKRSIAFYQRYCGMRVVRDRTEDFRVVWLGWDEANPQFALVLLETGYDTNAQPPYQHIGMAVDRREEIDEIVARAEADGLEVPWPPVNGGPIVGYFCGLYDPDGNIVEFSHGQPLG